jgi:Ca-activated chloride channel family protein
MQRGKHGCLSPVPVIQGLLVLLVMFCLPGHGQAASPYQAVQQGNALYQNGKYAEAAQQYGSASQMLPEAAEIHFNQGNAAYKQQDYHKAREHYTQALQTADRTLEGKVKYNLGNVEYQQALQNLPQPQAAIPHLRSAMTYYRDSLDVDPQQQDARYNLELSHLLLHKLQQEQQQSSQQQQEQSQDQQQPDQQRQAQQAQQRQDQQQQSQQQDASQQPTPSPDPQQGQQQQAASSEQQGQQAEQPQDASQGNAPPPGQQTAAQRELRPEEAARLLEAIRERGREADNQRQQRRAKTRASHVDKDW